MSRDHPGRLVIATRESALALWQAEHVRDAIRALHPDLDVVIDGMTTQGDRILDRSLSKVGGKGLFVKELEAALIEGRADLAVHSLKDVPMALAPGMALGAILPREDLGDVRLEVQAAQAREREHDGVEEIVGIQTSSVGADPGRPREPRRDVAADRDDPQIRPQREEL